MPVDKYILEDGATAANCGLWRTPDNFVTPATLQGSAFTGGKLLRRLAALPNSIGVFRIDTTPDTTTVNRLGGDGNANLSDTDGSYNAGADRYDGEDISGTGDISWRAEVHFTVPPGYTATDISMSVDLQSGSGNPRTNGIYANEVTTGSEIETQGLATGTFTISATGQNLQGGTVIIMVAKTSAAGGGGYARLTDIAITLESNDYIWRYSSTNGTSPTENTIGVYQGTQGDTDDFALGAVLVGASSISGAELYCCNSYTGAFSAISGLDGYDDGAAIICVRIPYRKLATQALNDSLTNLQVLYCTDRAVNGHTIFAANINCSTAAVTGIQSTLTPVIAGTTWRVISGANALETWGNNTQRIIALMKPVNGGATHLMHSINGGGSWSDCGAADYTRVHFVPSEAGGNGSVVTLAGGAGVAVSFNLGGTLQDKTGDFAAEAGSSDPLGAIVF